MKNANYNLVKMLLAKLDDAWRVEKFYAGDAKALGCKRCGEILKRILAEDSKHIEELREELARHIREEAFD